MRRLRLLLIVFTLLSIIPVHASGSPSPRMGATMFYDPVNQRVLLFGGALETPTGYIRYNDLWNYDYATDTWTEVETRDGPSGRFNTPAAYDPDTSQLIICGGATAGSSVEMWALSVADDTWARLTPPSLPSPGRWNTPLVYDEQYDKVIMFSGMAYAGGFPRDTWAYDAGHNAWERMSPDPTPVGHYGHSLVYDPVNNRTIMFGGHWWDEEDEGLGEGLWTYDYGSDTWAQLEEGRGPNPRYWNAYSVNTDSGELFIFGGTDARAFLDDTWIFRDGGWEQVISDTHPSARELAASTYDPVNKVTLLFGGQEGTRQLGDLWALDGTGRWTRLAGTGGQAVEEDGSNDVPGYPIATVFAAVIFMAMLKRSMDKTGP